jgi:hypothetical protein
MHGFIEKRPILRGSILWPFIPDPFETGIAWILWVERFSTTMYFLRR